MITIEDVEINTRLDKALGQDNESYIRLIKEIFRDAGWLVSEVLRDMRESDDFYCSLFAQIRPLKIHDDRVFLLDDTNYATPGININLAIIGGQILAGELLSYFDDVKTALKRYKGMLLSFAKSQ